MGDKSYEKISLHWRKRASQERSVEKVGIISWIVIGLIAGILGKILMPGDDPGGIFLTVVTGMVGAIVGGLVVGLLGGTGVTGLNIWSILGAVILITLYRLVAGRRT
jgi:uncharacterized membrane protein YeaQ/YmgE (transglycosylase-associated protein family)